MVLSLYKKVRYNMARMPFFASELHTSSNGRTAVRLLRNVPWVRQ